MGEEEGNNVQGAMLGGDHKGGDVLTGEQKVLGPMIQEDPCHPVVVMMAGCRGPVQCCPVIGIGFIDIRTMVDEIVHHRQMAVGNRG